MSTALTIQDLDAKIEDAHAAQYAASPERVKALEQHREAIRLQELADFNTLSDELAAVGTAHARALNEALDAYTAYIDAREKLAPLDLAVKAVRSRAYRHPNIQTPLPDSYALRVVSNYTVRELHNRAQAVLGGAW